MAGRSPANGNGMSTLGFQIEKRIEGYNRIDLRQGKVHMDGNIGQGIFVKIGMWGYSLDFLKYRQKSSRSVLILLDNCVIPVGVRE
jgi:hypothetical protein